MLVAVSQDSIREIARGETLVTMLGIAGGIAIFAVSVLLGWRSFWYTLRVIYRGFRGRCEQCGYNLRPTGGREPGCPKCAWNREEEGTKALRHGGTTGPIG